MWLHCHLFGYGTVRLFWDMYYKNIIVLNAYNINKHHGMYCNMLRYLFYSFMVWLEGHNKAFFNPGGIMPFIFKLFFIVWEWHYWKPHEQFLIKTCTQTDSCHKTWGWCGNLILVTWRTTGESGVSVLYKPKLPLDPQLPCDILIIILSATSHERNTHLSIIYCEHIIHV